MICPLLVTFEDPDSVGSFVMHHVLEALVMLDIMVKTKGGYKINPEILSSSVQDQRKPSSVEYLEDLARPGHQRAWRKTTARILVP